MALCEISQLELFGRNFPPLEKKLTGTQSYSNRAIYKPKTPKREYGQPP